MAGSAGVIFRRGFVNEFHCTLADFLSNPAVFAFHPITVVTLVDRQPIEHLTRSDGRRVYRWERTADGSDDLGPADVPEFSQLPTGLWRSARVSVTFGGTSRVSDPDRWRRPIDFASVLAARSALSRPCVDHGRSLAGLPPLVWPAPMQ